jgi:hypothetical protein
MEVSSADFMKLTINEVSDLLLEDIHSSGEDVKGALLVGKDNEGNPYRLSVILEVDKDD